MRSDQIGRLRIFFFFFNDTATTEIYTLSLHDALPTFSPSTSCTRPCSRSPPGSSSQCCCSGARSEEHTSELQSQSNLVCRLLLEKKKTYTVRGRCDATCSYDFLPRMPVARSSFGAPSR